LARAVAVGAIACAFASAAAPAGASVTTLDPSYRVKVERNVVVPMTDGTHLVADVYRPIPKPGQPANQKFPCLFETTPYRKEPRAAEAAKFFPPRGFVYMEMDGRGTGGSSGQYDGVFLKAEQEDGYDGIEWLATKYAACSGKVGGWGGSYSGINQYLIAASPKGRPPHLVTIAPQRALTDLYRDIVWTGGMVTGSFGVLWSGGTTGYNAGGADLSTGPDPAQAVRALTDHLGNDPMLLTYLEHPYDSPFYRVSSIIDRIQQLQMPILHLEGWYDAFTRGQLKGIGRLLELERAKKVRGPNYAIVGPWNHGSSHFLQHKPFDRRILEWYRHWLDGGPQPAWFKEPRVSYCVMQEALDGPCEWRHSNSWPPPRTTWSRLYLNPGNELIPVPPATTGRVDFWAYNALAGTGEAAFSKWDNAAGVPQRNADQAVEDELKGVSFSTPRLSKPLDVVGPIALHLRALTIPLLQFPTLDTDFVVKLSDVAPGGRSTLIQSGFLRASHRVLDPKRTVRVGRDIVVPTPFHDREHLAPVLANKPTDYDIEIWPTAKRFQVGHRLRITLYSADTPNHLTIGNPVLNIVLGGSYLLLPAQR
jgi:putative CocE/NonD family hydrolase